MENYIICSLIATGISGNVYRAQDIHTDIRRAIKVMPKRELALHRFQHEVSVLQALQYTPGIIKMIEYGENETDYFIVFELATGDIFDYPLKTHELKKFIDFLVTTVYKVHQKGYVVSDLKLENILRLGSGFALCDLSSAQKMACYNPHFYGTATLMPPEIAKAFNAGESFYYDEKTDIWCIGCILFEIVTHNTIVPRHENIGDVFQGILNHQLDWSKYNFKPRLRHDQQIKHIQTIITACLEKDRTKRCTMEYLLEQNRVLQI